MLCIELTLYCAPVVALFLVSGKVWRYRNIAGRS